MECKNFLGRSSFDDFFDTVCSCSLYSNDGFRFTFCPSDGRFLGCFGFKYKRQELQGSLDIRLIRTDTGEIVYVDKGSGGKKFKNLRVASIGGGTDFDQTMVNDIFEPIITDMATKMTTKVADLKITPAAMTKDEGKIIKVSGSQIYINLGSRNGVNAGDTFTVYRMGEALIDPDTGEELGANETRIGSLTVSSVQEKFSICSIASGSGFNTGDLVK